MLVKQRSKGLKFSLTRVSSSYLSNAGCSPCTIHINTCPFKLEVTKNVMLLSFLCPEADVLMRSL